LKPLVKRLVELNVQAKLIPQAFGNNLLTTFNVQPGGSALNPKAVTDAFLTGTTTSSEKFKNNLNKLLPNSASPDSLKGVVKVLVEYLIDNYVYDLNSLLQFLVAYGVGAEIDVQYIQMKTKPDQVKEPPLLPAKVPANMRVESSVSITQVLGDLWKSRFKPVGRLHRTRQGQTWSQCREVMRQSFGSRTQSARPKVWSETMDKEATLCASYLNGYVNGRFREKS
jgi:hypothetical protein